MRVLSLTKTHNIFFYLKIFNKIIFFKKIIEDKKNKLIHAEDNRNL